MNVLEGQRVKKGQVVAEIDPTDYKLDYDAKRASFQKASSQMQRAEKLLAKNAISMQEFERPKLRIPMPNRHLKMRKTH